MATSAGETFQSWLDDGWSPWRVGWGALSGSITVLTVVAYVRQRHNPGGTGYALVAAMVVILYLGSEVVRWRIKHSHAQKELNQKAPKTISKRHLNDLHLTAKLMASAVSAENVDNLPSQTELHAVRGHFPD